MSPTAASLKVPNLKDKCHCLELLCGLSPEWDALPAAHRYFRLDDGQLVLCSGQLGVSLGQSQSLGLHVTEDLIESHNVQTPRAQPCSRNGLGPDKVWLKRRVSFVRPKEDKESETDRQTDRQTEGDIKTR